MEITPLEQEMLQSQVIEALHKVYDPEIPIDIYELGLVYRVDVDTNGKIEITMTLTSPGCPVAGTLPGEVEMAAKNATGAPEVDVNVVWDPPWNMGMMSEAAQLELGMF